MSSTKAKGDGTKDRGAATALSAVLSIALISVLSFGFQLGAAAVHRHRAEGAADLAALAVAAAAPHGRELACGRAEWIATGMGAAIRECRLHEWEARVEVRTSVPGILSGLLHANARARAGPVS